MSSDTTEPVPPTPALRLAVVEDDAELREQILLPALAAAGFDVVGFSCARELYREWTRAPFSLVLLDVGLPDEDGVDIARHLRTLTDSVGIVIYSGHSSGIDRLRGLRAGIDAYLVKPVEIDELVQTLVNLGRRVAGADPAAAGGSGWRLDQRGWVLEAPSGAVVTLTRNERELLILLAERAGDTVPRETLIGHIARDAGSFDSHRLEVLVYRLRRKCLDVLGEPLAVHTVRGVGYRLDW